MTVSPHIDEDYTTVTGQYTLLQDWLTGTLDIIAPATRFIRLEVRDSKGVLETSWGDQGVSEAGIFQWLHVPLGSTAKGYTFTVHYEFNDPATLMAAGNLSYPVREGNERTIFIYSIPTDGVRVNGGYTYPAPQSAVQTEDGFRVFSSWTGSAMTSLLLMSRKGVLIRHRSTPSSRWYRPEERAIPSRSATQTGAEAVAEDVTFL